MAQIKARFSPFTPHVDRIIKEIEKIKDPSLSVFEAREIIDNVTKSDLGLDSFSNLSGEYVFKCDSCGELTLARHSKPVYFGMWNVCDICINNYTKCYKCKTRILTSEIDNPTHVHEARAFSKFLYEGVEPIMENANVMPFDADILQNKKTAQWFYTPEEVKVQSLRKIRLFGVELEVEKIKAGPSQLDARAIQFLNPNFFMIKHDGSLSNKGRGGFEIVTMPASLGYHQGGIWDYFFDHLAPFFQQAPATAALHIHFNLASVTTGIVDKIARFINDKRNLEFLANVSSRELGVPNPNGKVYASFRAWKPGDTIQKKKHSSSCPWNPENNQDRRYKRQSDGVVARDPQGHPIIESLTPHDILVRRACQCVNGIYQFQDHYSAFNLQTKRPTAELRIFRGVVKKDFLFGALEFTNALIHFCTDTLPDELTYQNFLEWICDGRRKAYPYASKLLIYRGWIDPPKSNFNAGLEASNPYAGV